MTEHEAIVAERLAAFTAVIDQDIEEGMGLEGLGALLMMLRKQLAHQTQVLAAAGIPHGEVPSMEVVERLIAYVEQKIEEREHDA